MEENLVFLLLALSMVLACAKVGGLIAKKLAISAMLGELLAGVVLGNLSLLGLTSLEAIRTDPILAALAELGVIILMFEVGLESTIGDLLRVGWDALVVALLGVVGPIFFGYVTIQILFPDLSVWVRIFLGATLCATSVGITARVLKDLGKGQSPEGRVILGAAVADDVLGLIVLAVVVALITSAGSGETLSAGFAGDILWIFFKAIAFLVIAIVVGRVSSKKVYRWASTLKVSGMLLTLSLVLCFAFSYLAHKFGLSPIVGAFAAGLILEPEHSEGFLDHEEHSLEHMILPLSTLLVPIFFIRIGMQVDLRSLFSLAALEFGGALTLAAVLGKMACAGGIVSKGERVDRWTVALGMIPRGEVGLIFASIGAGLKIGTTPLLNPALYAGVIMMVFITTAITPILLQRRVGVT